MEQQSLFGNRAGQDMPLATRMRPRTLEEFAGQRHLLGKGKVLRQLIADHCGADEGEFHQFQRRDERHQGNSRRDERGGAEPSYG